MHQLLFLALPPQTRSDDGVQILILQLSFPSPLEYKE
jgi:hypothetical protein